ncbi:chitinase [Cryptosporangium sp. NPDC048952]|uniref:chitinase n=1 Tax=Cryptosporangium sp. NPDC048952 TaxID=3363961 RepID=UPI0037182562
MHPPLPPVKGGRHKRPSDTPYRVMAGLGAAMVLAAGAMTVLNRPSDDTAVTASSPLAAVSESPSPLPVPDTPFEPYVDVGYYPPYDLAGSVEKAGISRYILGFVVAKDGCTPSWDGDLAIDDEEVRQRIDDFRAAGGDVRISFGGATGDELAAVCDSVPALADAYQRVIDLYSATAVDFDVEGNELGDTPGHVRRGEAIALLQKNAEASGKKLDVSLTLPVNPSGFTASPVRILTAAATAHARIDAVNVMAMDYGRWAAPEPEGMMGTYATQAMTNAVATIREVFGLSEEEAWSRIAVTPLIGVNSPATEVFSLDDAVKLGEFAREKGAAFYSMWSVTRDRPCPTGVEADADSDACAGNAPNPFAFTKAFLGTPGD